MDKIRKDKHQIKFRSALDELKTLNLDHDEFEYSVTHSRRSVLPHYKLENPEDANIPGAVLRIKIPQDDIFKQMHDRFFNPYTTNRFGLYQPVRRITVTKQIKLKPNQWLVGPGFANANHSRVLDSGYLE